MPVDTVVTRGKDPGQVLKKHLEEIETQGGTVSQIFPLHDEILVIWSKADREQRG